MSRKLVIIPTYNEASNAPILIRRIFKHISNVSVLVVDDGSPDGTSAKCKAMIPEFPNLYVEERAEKSGLGRDRKSTRLNSSHIPLSRMPSSA